MDLLARVCVLVLVAGCVSSEGDVLTSARDDGGVTDGDGGTSGDAGGCPAEPPCPSPPFGDIGVCGNVVDLETSMPMIANPPDVRVFDLLELRTDPLNAVELARVSPDGCGHYATSIDGSTEIIVVHTGDLPASPGSDYRGVASAIESRPNTTFRVNAWVLRDALDEQWSDDAEILGSFSAAGSVMTIFYDQNQPLSPPLLGTPVAGVTITSSGPGTPDDFYFSDTTPLSRVTIDPDLVVTGANGSGIVRATAQLSDYSGAKAGCNFGEAPALGVPFIVQVQEIAGACD